MKRRKTSIIILSFCILFSLASFLSSKVNSVGTPFLPPSFNNLMGTDYLGRDLFSRTSRAGFFTLIISGLSLIWPIIGGLLLGGYTGLSQNKLSFWIMRFIDVLIPIPSIILAMLILMNQDRNLILVSLSVGIPQIPFFARQIRSFAMPARGKEYIDAAILFGSSPYRIIVKHIFPNIRTEIFALIVTTYSWVLINLTTLDFIGFLNDSEIFTWGGMIGKGRLYLNTAPWIVIFPALMIILTIIGTNNLLGTDEAR